MGSSWKQSTIGCCIWGTWAFGLGRIGSSSSNWDRQCTYSPLIHSPGYLQAPHSVPRQLHTVLPGHVVKLVQCPLTHDFTLPICLAFSSQTVSPSVHSEQEVEDVQPPGHDEGEYCPFMQVFSVVPEQVVVPFVHSPHRLFVLHDLPLHDV